MSKVTPVTPEELERVGEIPDFVIALFNDAVNETYNGETAKVDYVRIRKKIVQKARELGVKFSVNWMAIEPCFMATKAWTEVSVYRLGSRSHAVDFEKYYLFVK